MDKPMMDNWINGNRKDVVNLIRQGLLSDAIEFALSLSKEDRVILLKMLRNREIARGLTVLQKHGG
jgi:hypothetical protein